MTILSLNREDIIEFVKGGMMRPENIQHYDICKELSEGKKLDEIAGKFEIADFSTIRYIVKKKCPECKG